MKKVLVILAAAGFGFIAAGVVYSSRQAALDKISRDELARQQAAWQSEKAKLEAALNAARVPTAAAVPTAPQFIETVRSIAPAEILDKLKSLKMAGGQARGQRQAIHLFESLIEAGPAALPAIRGFLARNEEIDYDAGGKGPRDGKVPTEFLFPPSLRLGLFEAVKNIGGPDAEKVLAEVLSTTGRGVEVAWLARALQEMAPGKYRDTALAAARELLTHPLAGGEAGADKFDRSYLYGVLGFFNDTSAAAAAQAQLVQLDGQIDRVALRYLQQTLGEQSIAIAAQFWQDPRIPADQKEPLARVALTYAGVNPQADQLYQTAINDPTLPNKHRQNLIEDLNEAGFADPKHLTPADLPLIQKRIGMIEQIAPNAMDQVNAKAFQEAYKDLVKMQNSLVPKPAPAK